MDTMTFTSTPCPRATRPAEGLTHHYSDPVATGMRLGLREANHQFSRAMRAVRAGEEVVLTERGRPTERQLTAILSRIRSDRLRWDLMEVSPLVLNRAEELVTQASLRPLDAIHVASALAFRSATGIRVPFITGGH